MQKRIFRDGYYKCQVCGNVYQIEDGDEATGDGTCTCGERDLDYLGKELPADEK